MGTSYRLTIAFVGVTLTSLAMAVPVTEQAAQLDLTSEALVLTSGQFACPVTMQDATLTKAGIPDWIVGAAVNAWIEISGTTHAGSAADPTDDPLDSASRSNKRLKYSRGAVAGTEYILPATGGHNDNSRNSVTGIDLSADAPAWALRKASTWNGSEANVAYYEDGTPASRHGYWSAIYSATNSRLMLHRSRVVAGGSAASYDDSNGFNLATNTWDADGTWADGHTAGCQDSDGNVWAITSEKILRKWTAATDSWATTLTSGTDGPVYPLAFDSSRSQLFACCIGNGEAGSGVRAAIWTSGGTVRTEITFNASAAYTDWQTEAGNLYGSMEYDADNDRFLWWGGVDREMYVITPNGTTTWDMSKLTTTGTKPPVRVSDFGRMVQMTIGTAQVLVFMPSGNTNLHALRIA